MFNSRESLIQAIKKSDLSPVDAKEGYDTMLDDIYGTVNIAGYDYEASHALGMVDPIAYNDGLAEYCSSQVSEGVWFDGGSGYYCAYDIAEHFEMDVDDILEFT